MNTDEWVHYTVHKAEMERLKRKCDQLRRALRRIDSDLEGRNFLENSSLRDTARVALKEMEDNE